MAFASSVGLGIRHGSARVGSRNLISGNSHFVRSNARLFSSLLQHSHSNPRIVPSTFAAGSRNLSLWGSSKPSTPETAVPETVASTPTPTESIAASVADASVPPDIHSAAGAASAIDTSAVVDPSAAVGAVDVVNSGIADALAAHTPTILQWGELASQGLTTWSPAGIVRWSLEWIHLGIGLPWFWTIVAGTAAWRIFCMPFVVKGLRTSAALLPIQGEVQALQQRLMAAQATKNTLELQKTSIAMRQLYAAHGISPLSGFVALVQIPVTLGVFFGIQTICKLPLESLKYSGFALLPDLTVADPTYILPVILTAAINLQVYLGARELNTTERPDMGHMMNALRLLTIPGFWIMAGFPTGLTLSLLTTASLTATQSLLLRSDAVRRLLKIPIVPPEARGKLPSMMETFRRAKTFFGDDLKAQVEQARQQQVAQRRMDVRRR